MIRRRPTRFSRFGNLNKKKSQKPTVDGYVFDSSWEVRRYEGTLRLRLLAGEIRDLEVHPSWPIVINGQRCGRITADFKYYDIVAEKWCVEDAKAWATNRRTGKREPIVESGYAFRRNVLFALHGLWVETV